MDKNDKIAAAIHRVVDDINEKLENGKKFQKCLTHICMVGIANWIR